jgi:hypothetical protein
MAYFPQSTGGVNAGEQAFAGPKHFETIVVDGISGFSGFSGSLGAGTGTIKMGGATSFSSCGWVPIVFNGFSGYIPVFAQAQ